MSDDNNDGLIRPNEVVAGYLARAKEAHMHLGKTWEYWLDIGHAIWEFKKQLDEAIRPNETGQRPEDTQRHRDSMGEFLRVNHFHENDPEGFTKAERMNLMHIMERLPEIEAFRKKYGEDEGQKKLRKLNNPSTVWRKFCGPKQNERKPGLKASVAEFQQQIDELEAENNSLCRERETLQEVVAGGPDWQSQLESTAKTHEATEIAKTIWSLDGPEPAEAITNAMVQQFAAHLGREEPESTRSLFDTPAQCKHPLAFIRENSQQARQYAETILGHLDGQTDEPHEDRLARRITNGRGVEASLKLARAIVVYVASEIKVPYAEIVAKMGADEPKPEIYEEERRVWGPRGAAAMMEEIMAAPFRRAEPEATEEPPPPNPDPLAGENVRNFVQEYLHSHPRDGETARTIRSLYKAQTGAGIGITVIEKYVREIAPLPRGRKPKPESVIEAAHDGAEVVLAD